MRSERVEAAARGAAGRGRAAHGEEDELLEELLRLVRLVLLEVRAVARVELAARAVDLVADLRRRELEERRQLAQLRELGRLHLGRREARRQEDLVQRAELLRKLVARHAVVVGEALELLGRHVRQPAREQLRRRRRRRRLALLRQPLAQPEEAGRAREDAAHRVDREAARRREDVADGRRRADDGAHRALRHRRRQVLEGLLQRRRRLRVRRKHVLRRDHRDGRRGARARNHRQPRARGGERGGVDREARRTEGQHANSEETSTSSGRAGRSTEQRENDQRRTL